MCIDCLRVRGVRGSREREGQLLVPAADKWPPTPDYRVAASPSLTRPAPTRELAGGNDWTAPCARASLTFLLGG